MLEPPSNTAETATADNAVQSAENGVQPAVEESGDATPLGDHLFRLLVQSVRDYAIFLLDPTGRILTWNEGAQRIKGYAADEIIGKHFSIFYPPQEVRRGKPLYGLSVARAEGRWEEEGWRVRSDGSRFWASVVITALRDAEGTLVGFAKVTRDLSERKQAEDERSRLLEMERTARVELEATLERLQAIQSVTEAALAHLSLDELLADLLDRVSDILAVDTVAILLHEPERDVLQARAAKGIEEEVRRGIEIPVGVGFAGRIAAERQSVVLDDVEHSDVLNPILREKGIKSLLGVPLLVQGQVVGVIHVGTLYHRRFSQFDIQFLQLVADRVALAIDHARLLETMLAARRDAEIAEAALRAQEQFLSVAAHELRTPTTSLRMATQLLLRKTASGASVDPQQLRDMLATVERQSTRLARLVTQLLETVRVQSERLELDRTLTDITELTTLLVGQMQAHTTRHQIHVSSPGPLWATVDPLRLEQVLTNLLDNAIKFSPDGGQIDVDLSATSSGGICLSVRDHGIGVAPEHRSHIFERFYQAHTREHRSGMGLGLYITREIVLMHSGTIRVEFPPDGGTRFVVNLPPDGEDAQLP